MRDENHAAGFGQGEVVGLGAGAAAQGVEVEPQYAVGLALGGDVAAEQGQAAGLGGLAGVALEQDGEMNLALGIVGNEEDVGGAEAALAVVLAAVHVEDVEAFFEQGDGGQEAAAVLALRVEPGRLVVGGGHEHHAFGQQAFEQAAENHGVGDVAHVEFVEAEDLGVAGDVAGHGLQGVGLVFVFAHAAVGFGHEGVEVYAAGGAGRQAAVEGVHQEAFAAPDAAVEIEAFGRLGLFAEEFAQQAAALLAVGIELVPELVEAADGGFLGGIADKAGLPGRGLIPAQGAVAGEGGRGECGHDVRWVGFR